jgi:integrase
VPENGDVVAECADRRAVRRHGVVCEITGDDLAEPFPGVRDRQVPSLPQPFLDLPQLGAHAVATRLPLDLEIAPPGFAADQHEAQELEGLRFAEPTLLAILRRMAAELDQAGLVRVQRQRELPQPFAHSEARALLDSIDTSTPAGLRDRALIGLMVYSFARVGAALGMTIEDVYTQNRRLWVRLREKGGKRHAMPCHHNLDEYLVAYLDGAGLRDDPKGPLFRTIGRGTGQLTRTVLPQANAYAMIRRRAAAAGIETKLGNHSFRATGITAYLKNGGTLEKAAAMANHASTRTTQLYDRRRDEVSLDEVERIMI